MVLLDKQLLHIKAIPLSQEVGLFCG